MSLLLAERATRTRLLNARSGESTRPVPLVSYISHVSRQRNQGDWHSSFLPAYPGRKNSASRHRWFLVSRALWHDATAHDQLGHDRPLVPWSSTDRVSAWVIMLLHLHSPNSCEGP